MDLVGEGGLEVVLEVILEVILGCWWLVVLHPPSGLGGGMTWMDIGV
jgi:hypothetical protein